MIKFPHHLSTLRLLVKIDLILTVKIFMRSAVNLKQGLYSVYNRSICTVYLLLMI